MFFFIYVINKLEAQFLNIACLLLLSAALAAVSVPALVNVLVLFKSVYVII